MSGRRTRAAAKSAPMATAQNAIQPIVDQNFASPKRKDCKLDTDSMSSLTNGYSIKSSPSQTTTTIQPATNAKRNHKNATNTKSKKSSPAITKYFPRNECHSLDNSIVSENTQHLNGSIVDLCESPVPKKHDEDDSVKVIEKCESKLNGSILLSPEAKSILNGSQIKQTTPHRIVCHQSSPSKKQRLYVKDPVEVFSNLNIRDGTSPKTKPTNRNRKNHQKSRRKLNVNENSENNKTTITTNGLIENDDVPTVVNGDVTKSLSNGTIDQNANQKPSTKEFIAPKVPATRNTQLTEYFPIRRSARKTKQVVEQEQSRFIEIAIEKQLEDGLIVKDFGEKGRGIVAGRRFQRGEFVVEYIGELIDQAEADRREEEYAKNAEFGCYMYYFKHKEQQWCIDATAESGKLGRLVNHSRNGNLSTKIVSYKNKPHLVLLAKDDIEEGVELTYDYGDRRKEALIHHPWLAF